MSSIAPLTLADMESAARASMDAATWAYLAGGAGTERGIAGNLQALDNVWLQPRALQGGASASTECSILGTQLSLPVLLAPTSPQRLFHPEAELATARAALESGSISIVSTDTHFCFADIAEHAPQRCWFQLYAYSSRREVDASLDMAAEAGATALVLTVDASFSARRLSTRRAGFHVPPDIAFGTLRSLGIGDGSVPANGRMERLALSWQDLERLRRRWKGPLLLKGVLDPNDAQRGVDSGADGLIISNHGGRQLDAVVPSLWALRRIVAHIGRNRPLLLDGGIRSGTDIIKALAMGAHAICIGRPYLWGLALDGKAGVQTVLSLLHEELQDAMMQMGMACLEDIGPDCLVDPSGLGALPKSWRPRHE
ncbi:alpha-hydroxy-acid oxidizing protein [Mitsuaria sp. WAJ17]|uniref:alpha-hydroxy acid oxidase n=1 Tax=Mitsuaria sp. WAJ17 TaxID=2761452 RepID=UPI0016047291|nr:alpha-hydroxy acid oxidase [Mitsuaria sp. WAJ17]MBB2487890.1 alpha-hydroxy-acid oxidizing protein [Mitsuaria sp. WAJ17]